MRSSTTCIIEILLKSTKAAVERRRFRSDPLPTPAPGCVDAARKEIYLAPKREVSCGFSN